jgi:Tfp pilus assembly protein PilF
MTFYTSAEDNLLVAEQHLYNGEIAEAKRALEDILDEEPDFGRAHNHLGWIYYQRLDNYQRAAYHFRLAVKFSPDYPGGHTNYVGLLIDTNQLEKAKAALGAAIQVKGIDKTRVLTEYGRYFELQKDYTKALEYYREAVESSLDMDEMDEIKANVKRVKRKLPFFRRIVA